MNFLGVEFQAVEKLPDKPVSKPDSYLPLKKEVWYKLKCGRFAYAKPDTRETSDLIKFDLYQRKGDFNSNYDFWTYIRGSGLVQCARSQPDYEDHIIGLADEPVTADSVLPLKLNTWYPSTDGKWIKTGNSVDSDNDIRSGIYSSRDSEKRIDWGYYNQTTGARKATRFAVDLNHPSLRPQPSPKPTSILSHVTNPMKTSPMTSPAVSPEHISSAISSLLAINQEAIGESVKRHIQEQHQKIKQEAFTELLTAMEAPIGKLVTDAAKGCVVVKEVIIKDRVNPDHQVTIQTPHPALEEAIEISRAINNVWLCGPAGSGKTTLAAQLAQSLGIDYSFISCTSGMSEAKLLGRMNVQGTYLPAEFVRIYEEGGVFLWDEFDAADPNVVLCANAAMANGHLSVPDRVSNPVAKRHPSTILIVATNTWGRGATSEYTARESLDAATRDRFVLSKIGVGYSPDIETQYLGAYDTVKTTPWAYNLGRVSLQNVFVKIRENIEKHHLRRVMSTRAFVQAAALRKLGWDDSRIVARYFLDWTDQERSKALEGVG